jgi:hypothetical protein
MNYGPLALEKIDSSHDQGLLRISDSTSFAPAAAVRIPGIVVDD